MEMNGRERLEEIKHNHMVCHQGSVKTTSIDLENMEWLIEQAERKQHLEMKYENTGSVFGRQNQLMLIKENKKLREALEFYANYDNYYEAPWADTHIESDVQRDCGRRATKALEELK